ncbi:MAG: cyclic nucleotide-binding domain-containing protein [Leptolyngbyaceae bacterium]|nr:cyclic nucleotide-binding domain-containing protein [Leptolyngbyaceae bacterium]
MRLPIRVTLPILIVMPIIAAVGLGGWLSYLSEQEVVHELAEEISRKATGSIERHITNHLADSKVVYQTMLATLQGSGYNMETSSPETLADTIWYMVQQQDLPDRIFFGSSNGDYLGFSDAPDGGWTIQIRNKDTLPNRLTYRLNDQREPTDLLQSQIYDPRVRVWYEKAVESGDFTWSPVYAFATEPTLGVTAAQPIYTSAGELKGVFGIDVSLASLGQFLEELEISPEGHAFVMERTGELIATSMNTELFTVIDQEKHRIFATESHNPLIQGVATQLLDEMGQFSTVTTSEEFILDISSVEQFIGVNPIFDPAGIDWIVVVMVPSTDFREITLTSLRSTIQVGLLVAIGASLMGIFVARWIAQPISRLTRAACQIESEQYDPSVLTPVLRRNDEFGRLARIFQDMAKVIYSRQKGLQQQLQQLQEEHARQSLRHARLTQINNITSWQKLVYQSRSVRNAIALAQGTSLAERLQRISYFQNFTLEERYRLLEFGEERYVPPGTDICQAGEHGEELFFLLDGTAEVLTDEDPPRYLTSIHAGEVVGEFAMLLNVPRVANVRAVTPTALFVVNRDGLRQVLTEYPDLEERILMTLKQRQSTSEKLSKNLTVIQSPESSGQPNYLDWVRNRLRQLIHGS